MMGTFHAQLSDNAAVFTAHAIQALTFGGLTMAMGNGQCHRSLSHTRGQRLGDGVDNTGGDGVLVVHLA
jgi:hypothetical protein